jgi:hypothetical protein
VSSEIVKPLAIKLTQISCGLAGLAMAAGVCATAIPSPELKYLTASLAAAAVVLFAGARRHFNNPPAYARQFDRNGNINPKAEGYRHAAVLVRATVQRLYSLERASQAPRV